jgi:hypothetical protein
MLVRDSGVAVTSAGGKSGVIFAKTAADCGPSPLLFLTVETL